MKVLIVVITDDKVHPECMEALLAQDYHDFNIYVNKKEPDASKNWLENIVDNRNEAREKVLGMEADYFLFVDSDVVFPPDALSSLMLQMGPKRTTLDFPDGKGGVIPKGTPVPEKFIMGGWYPVEKNQWNCGKWVADNTFANYPEVQKSLVHTDKIDFGCVLMKREVLEKVKFRFDPALRRNENQFLCECQMFAIDAQDAGYELYMNGDVICKHLKEESCRT